MARLLLVRHGEVESNDARRYWGHRDVPLNAVGRDQAERLRDRLVGDHLAAVYSSDLSRARETAEIIAQLHRAPVVQCPELREIAFGRFEGLTFDEVKTAFPEAEKHFGGDATRRFPGGESLADLSARVGRFAERLEGLGADQTILVVGHGGSLRVLICLLLGLDVTRWWQLRVDRASLSIVETFTEGGVLSLLNDVSHLRS